MNRRRPGARTHPTHADERLRGSRLAVPFARVWVAALAVAGRNRGWEITDQDPGAGRIVVEATTSVLGFVDHVVISLSLDGNGDTRVDMTSHSRVGRYDFGANARRIRRFLRQVERELARG